MFNGLAPESERNPYVSGKNKAASSVRKMYSTAKRLALTIVTFWVTNSHDQELEAQRS